MRVGPEGLPTPLLECPDRDGETIPASHAISQTLAATLSRVLATGLRPPLDAQICMASLSIGIEPPPPPNESLSARLSRVLRPVGWMAVRATARRTVPGSHDYASPCLR